MDTEGREDSETGKEEEAKPVCLRCFREISPLAHFCPHCGEAAGQYTPSLPFESVRWQAQTWGKACRQVWSPGTSAAGRFFRAVMLAVSGPLVAAAALLAGVFSRTRSGRHPGDS
jgi:hypothetical protein